MMQKCKYVVVTVDVGSTFCKQDNSGHVPIDNDEPEL